MRGGLREKRRSSVSDDQVFALCYAEAGLREILECWFEQPPIREEYLIVDGSMLAGAGAHSYSAGDTTFGSRGGE